MAPARIYNLGSINDDAFYRVAHFVKPGETIKAHSVEHHLGGKGVNQSVAVAKSGGQAIHIGAVGANSQWILDQISGYGVPLDHIAVLPDTPTGSAIVALDDAGENAIMINPGANGAISNDQIDAALGDAGPGDWLLLQNETNNVAHAVFVARERGVKICLSAAPFDRDQVLEFIDQIDLIAVNEIEAAEVSAALGTPLAARSHPDFLITKGAKGATFLSNGQEEFCPSFKVTPVDTTGAGDTFLGVFITQYAANKGVKAALQTASAASAIQITRVGAANAIPTLNDINQYLKQATK